MTVAPSPRPATSTESLRVFYDGECRMCSGAVAWALARDRDGALLPIAAQSDEARALGIDPQRLLEELHAWSPGEGWRRGPDAVAAMLARLPGWRWVGRLLMAPGVRTCARPVYRWIARRRGTFGGATCPLPTRHSGRIVDRRAGDGN